MIEDYQLKKTEIQRTLEWFEAAVPAPTIENVCVQIGCHLEEVAEMLDCLMVGENIVFKIDELATAFKQKKPLQLKLCRDLVDSGHLTAFVDSIGDQYVTGLGCLHMLGVDAHGVIKEINDSNYSKFGDDGKPIFDANGKIKKGAYYREPQLKQFLHKKEGA